MEEEQMNFFLKIIKKNGEIVFKCQTHSIRRFLKNLRMIKWQDESISAYLRVSYGKGKDVFGKIVTFYNDGWYETEEDLWLAFEAFMEK